MDSFLYRVASIYYQHYKENLNDFTFVFPNRRAGLFFQKYLAEIIEKPLFSPQITTIDSCFTLASDLQLTDKISNLFKLYTTFKTISNSNESFDNFAFWGEMLLADFNEVDKYRIDAKQLFFNIKDLKEIDSSFEDIFSKQQIQAINHFLKGFHINTKTGEEKEHFFKTWEVLYPVYKQFRDNLLSDGLAYEGMAARWVTDKLLADEPLEWIIGKQFVFIGFNALNPCEKVFMTELQRREQADFYWDYESDALQSTDNPASLFFKENTTLFKSKYSIPIVKESLENKEIELIEIPSSVGQSKQIYQIINDLHPENTLGSLLETAVILPDENLLLPSLYSIPEHIDKINITMGYPLSFTPVAGLMEHIFELHKRKKQVDKQLKFYHLTVSKVLNHQFVALICGDIIQAINQQIQQENLVYVPMDTLHKHELLQLIFNPDIQADGFIDYLLNITKSLYAAWQQIKDESADYQLESGFLYQYYITLNRLQGILSSQAIIIDLNTETLIRLIKQLTSNINIPFVGEPLEGLQIIGALETRGLDFKNIIISSFNEGVYPKKSIAHSFIPYNLRKGFGLPTYEHQDAITSYNFYRLIHRAKRIFLLFDSRTEGGSSGEVSRFFQQLKFHYGLQIKEQKLSFNMSIPENEAIIIQKDHRILEQLKSFLAPAGIGKSALSASSINTYINCPLQFYFSYIEKMSAEDELAETIAFDVFGSIFHQVIAELYKPYKGQLITQEVLQDLSKDNQRIEDLINQAFAELYFKKKKNEKIELQGNNLLIAHIITKYIKGVLQYDKAYAPFTYIGGEEPVQATLLTHFGDINLKGYIDRIDEKEGGVRIIDYKTGGGTLEFKEMADLFDKNVKKHAPHVVQTLLYGYLFSNERTTKKITPAIYYIRNIFDPSFTPYIKDKNLSAPHNLIWDYFAYEDEFLSELSFCVEEIFNPNIPFTQADDTTACTYCDFKNICKR